MSGHLLDTAGVAVLEGGSVPASGEEVRPRRASAIDNVEFFASSVVGSLGYATNQSEGYVTPVPLHTALRGVLEPFQWIIDQV